MTDLPRSMTTAELRAYRETGRVPGSDRQIATDAAGGDNRREQRRALRRDEDAIQRAIVQWLELLGRRLLALWWHTPNGGARSPVEAAIFQHLGVRAGAPDLVFLWAGGCACMEVKRPGGSLSGSQRLVRAQCVRLGIPYVTVRSLDEAMAAVDGWGLVRAAEMEDVR